MKNNVTVIVGESGRVKRFIVYKRLKYVLGAALGLAVVSAVSAVITLAQLRAEVAHLEATKTALNMQKMALKETIGTQRDELQKARERMDAIELAMGLEHARQTPLDYRVQRASISTESRARVLELIPNGSPVPYRGISSKFGYRTNPITRKRELHRGTDLKAAMDTPICATADGVVEFAGSQNTKGYGSMILIDHAYGFRTLYGHLHKIEVITGQLVKKGDIIGYTGSSGLSNGPHLHYEVRFIQRSLNPYWFVKWNLVNYDEIFFRVKQVTWMPILRAIAEDATRPELLEAKAAL